MSYQVNPHSQRFNHLFYNYSVALDISVVLTASSSTSTHSGMEDMQSFLKAAMTTIENQR